MYVHSYVTSENVDRQGTPESYGKDAQILFTKLSLVCNINMVHEVNISLWLFQKVGLTRVGFAIAVAFLYIYQNRC